MAAVELANTGVVPKRSGASRKADIAAFFGEALANGSVAAREVQGLRPRPMILPPHDQEDPTL
jgi:hypothetical protein